MEPQDWANPANLRVDTHYANALDLSRQLSSLIISESNHGNTTDAHNI
jgi:hypothetical protein